MHTLPLYIPRQPAPPKPWRGAVHLASAAARFAVTAAVLTASLCSGQVQTPAPASADASGADTPTAAASTPTPPSPLIEARKLLAAADYLAADRFLRDVVLHTPNSGEAHFLLGFALLHEQKPAASLAEYSLGAKFKEPGPEELIGVASNYLQLQAYADAERWLREAARRAPEKPVVWYMLGRAQYSQGLWADAQRSFLSCLRLDPHHLRAQSNLGLTDEMLHHPDEAAAAYRAAIAMQEGLSTKDVQPYLDLGMLLRKQGRAADALPLLTTAAGNGSRDPVAHQELGLAYEQLGKYDEAVGELKAAITLAPRTEALHFFLGRLYRKIGHPEEASREFAQAARLSTPQLNAAAPAQAKATP